MPIARNPQANRLGAGTHLVVIASIVWATDASGNKIASRDGSMALDIKFKNNDSLVITGRFWLTENAEWVLEGLYKAIGLRKSEEIDVKKVLGRRLWICVAEKRIIKNKTTYTYYELLPRFYTVFDPNITPSIAGDPRLNGGDPSGIFLIIKDEDTGRTVADPAAFEAPRINPFKQSPEDFLNQKKEIEPHSSDPNLPDPF